jgi:recombination protein RecA
MFGSPETTTGGNALKYYASVRLDVRRIGSVKSGEAHIGNRTRVKVVKNKLAPPFKKVEFDIRYGTGIDTVGDLLDTAVEAGVVEKAGAYYRFNGENIGQGREKARVALIESEVLTAKMKAKLSPAKEPVVKPGSPDAKPAAPKLAVASSKSPGKSQKAA